MHRVSKPLQNTQIDKKHAQRMACIFHKAGPRRTKAALAARLWKDDAGRGRGHGAALVLVMQTWM
ncbi:MAG: hypothetical protein ACKOPO_14210, partial [Novosphingobium sp.]